MLNAKGEKMDISNSISDFQQYDPEFPMSCCIVNREKMQLYEIQGLGYDEFASWAKNVMPRQLYRYYPNIENFSISGETVNYSLQALENNTVFLQTPTEFDDVYDSDINIDFTEYEHLRLIEYCHRCGLDIDKKQSSQDISNALVRILRDYYIKNGNLKGAFINTAFSVTEKQSNELFAFYVTNALYEMHDFCEAIACALQKEYCDFVAELKTTFRTACFATTPYSQLMWGGSYANYHRGFCIEYTVLPNHEDYQEVYHNLFPMIYCKVRPDITTRLVEAKDKEFTKERVWDIYLHGALRKSIDWAFQNEWRLLLPVGMAKSSDYNIKFFPITKVYLGNRMEVETRRTVIDICNRKNIPYVGVKRNSALFEMQDCEIKCENCLKYKSMAQ